MSAGRCLPAPFMFDAGRGSLITGDRCDESFSRVRAGEGERPHCPTGAGASVMHTIRQRTAPHLVTHVRDALTSYHKNMP